MTTRIWLIFWNSLNQPMLGVNVDPSQDVSATLIDIVDDFNKFYGTSYRSADLKLYRLKIKLSRDEDPPFDLGEELDAVAERLRVTDRISLLFETASPPDEFVHGLVVARTSPSRSHAVEAQKRDVHNQNQPMDMLKTPFGQEKIAALTAFKTSVWGKKKLAIEMNVEGFISNEVVVPPFTYLNLAADATIHRGLQTLFGILRKFQFLLIRREYHEAREAIIEHSNSIPPDSVGGRVILGQPGIGKTLFLVYFLLWCLQNSMPVAIQTRPDYYVLFTEDSVIDCPCNISDFLWECPRVWALSDSDMHVTLPAYGFLHSNTYIVQATSAPVNRFKTWCEERYGVVFVMDIWRDEELRALAMLHNFDVDQFIHYAALWGPSVGALVKIMTTPSYAKLMEDNAQEAANWLTNNVLQ